MDERTKRRYRLKADIFKALAHPMRLYMLDRLRERAWCVCELAADAGIAKSAASKHLSQLKAAGLVDDERLGTRVEYRLLAPCVPDLADCAERTVSSGRRRRPSAAGTE